MNKQITSIFLVAGTCIGAGMFALPLTFAKIGIIPSIIIIILTWLFTYYCSLIYVELNLHCNKKNINSDNNNINSLPLVIAGKKASLFENINIKLLSYSALSAYIYGCSSIFQKLIGYDNLFIIQTFLTIFTFFLFLFNTDIISKINNIAFIFLVSLFFIVVIRMLTFINFSNVPIYETINFYKILPIFLLTFLSFGYQLIFYAIRQYCDNDATMIKKAYFYGSIIPMFVYILWTFVSLSIIYKNNIIFYNSIVNSNVEVGDFIQELSKCLHFSELQIVIYIISIFTIFTSIVGVGLGVKNSFSSIFKSKGMKNHNILSSLITIVPPYIVSVFIPNAFMKILNFGGIFLIILSVLLPIYLYFKAIIEKPYIKILNKYALILCSIIGLIIMAFSLPTLN